MKLWYDRSGSCNDGRGFQTSGPATLNTLEQIFVRVRGTQSLKLAAEQWRSQEFISGWGTKPEQKNFDFGSKIFPKTTKFSFLPNPLTFLVSISKTLFEGILDPKICFLVLLFSIFIVKNFFPFFRAPIHHFRAPINHFGGAMALLPPPSLRPWLISLLPITFLSLPLLLLLSRLLDNQFNNRISHSQTS